MRNYRQIGGTGASYLSALGSGVSEGGEIVKEFDYNIRVGDYPDIWDGTFVNGSLTGNTLALGNSGNVNYQTTNWIECNEKEIYYFTVERQPSVLQFSINLSAVNGNMSISNTNIAHATIPANIKFFRIYYSQTLAGYLKIERMR